MGHLGPTEHPCGGWVQMGFWGLMAELLGMGTPRIPPPEEQVMGEKGFWGGGGAKGRIMAELLGLRVWGLMGHACPVENPCSEW